MHPVDVAALLLRAVLGVTMLAHGWNHAFGGGKIAGTTRWFASIGMRPAWVHAYVATLTEIGSGVLLLLGLLTPLAAAGVLGTMLVALVTAHLKNGFFIFRPGQGYEYVLMICVVALALAGTGGEMAVPGPRARLPDQRLGGLRGLRRGRRRRRRPHPPHLLAPGPAGSRADRGRDRGLTDQPGRQAGLMSRQIKAVNRTAGQRLRSP